MKLIVEEAQFDTRWAPIVDRGPLLHHIEHVVADPAAADDVEQVVTTEDRDWLQSLTEKT